MIERLITSRARVQVLQRLLLHPDDEYYCAQLEGLLDLRLRSVHRELKLLEEAGILQSRGVGRTILYRANRECPIFPELHSMLLKTVGLGEGLARHVGDAEGAKWAFIYGSVARTDEAATSDVDLMIVGDVDGDRLAEVLNRAEEEIGRPLNCSVFSEEEIRERLLAGDSFVRTVLAEPKIMLIGDESELRKLAA